MARSNIQTIAQAIRANNNLVLNEHNNQLSEVKVIGLCDGNVVALYEHDYFTLSAIELSGDTPKIRVGSVTGGVITIEEGSNLPAAIEDYNNLENYDEWYRKYHKQITHVTYLS